MRHARDHTHERGKRGKHSGDPLRQHLSRGGQGDNTASGDAHPQHQIPGSPIRYTPSEWTIRTIRGSPDVNATNGIRHFRPPAMARSAPAERAAGVREEPAGHQRDDHRPGRGLQPRQCHAHQHRRRCRRCQAGPPAQAVGQRAIQHEERHRRRDARQDALHHRPAGGAALTAHHHQHQRAGGERQRRQAAADQFAQPSLGQGHQQDERRGEQQLQYQRIHVS